MSATGPVPAAGGRHRPGGGERASRRWAALGLVAVVLIGAGAVDRAVTRRPAGQAPVPLAAQAAATDAESASWYCVGGSSGPGVAAATTVYLTNTAPTAATGTVSVVDGKGTRRGVPVTVPPDSQVAVDPATIVAGTGIAVQIDLTSGGVVATQAVRDPDGWSEAPCASSTRGIWYFPTGDTSAGHRLFVALYNPTSASAVVDLSFVTAGGLTQPAPFQGIVLAPGRVTAAEIGSYVQDQGAVATIVTAGSGRVVADELELVGGAVEGESLQLGSPAPERRWDLPRSADVTGGSTTFSIFNPSATAPQRVTVLAHLPSGPVAPFSAVVPPDATWVLDTSRATRIPPNVGFSLTVLDHDPEGVVTGRTEQSAPSGAVPQVGSTGAIPASVSSSPARRWVLPAPGAGGAGAVPGAGLYSLDLQNSGASAVTVSVGFLAPHGTVPLPGVGTFRLRPASFAVVPAASLAPAGLRPLVVSALGPLAVAEDVVPVGVAGVVVMPGIP